MNVILGPQGLQHVMIIATLMTFIIVLATGTPLNELLGTRHAGIALYAAALIILGCRAVMSCLMATLRLIYVACPRWLNNFGPKRMGGIFLPIALLYVVAFESLMLMNLTPYNLFLNFASDRSVEKSKILWMYGRGDYREALTISQITVMTTILFHVQELLCYIVIFIHLYFHDRSLKSLLSQEAYKKRKNANAITLVSQVILFASEISVLVLASLRHFFPSYGTLLGFAAFLNVFLTSILTVAMSRPMRTIIFQEVGSVFQKFNNVVSCSRNRQ